MGERINPAGVAGSLRSLSLDGEELFPQVPDICLHLLHFSLQLVKLLVLPGFKVLKPLVQLVPQDHQDGHGHSGSCRQANHSRQVNKHWGNRRHWAKEKFYPNRVSSMVRAVARITDPCRCYGLISPSPWSI